jgi:hypothetical protein
MSSIKGFLKNALQARIWVGLICLMFCAFSFQPLKAQDQDIQQLILDIEKLTQFKAILSDMRQGLFHFNTRLPTG